MSIKKVLFGLLVTALMTLSHQSYAQTKPSKIKEYLSLTGTVNMVCLFVETDEGDWEEEEIEAYYKEYLRAQDWIVNQGEDYAQEVDFNNEAFYIDNKKLIYIDAIRLGDRPKTTLAKVFEELNYANFEDFTASNNFDFEEEKLKIVLMVKQNARSHAWNYWSVEEVDLAIVYCKSTYGMRTDQYVMAHEILHQFGAWDLYKGESQTSESAAKAAEAFPHSVMASTFSNKHLLVVDELTASRIGWKETEASYAYYNPKNHREQARKDQLELMKKYKGKESTEIKFNLGKKKKKEN